MLDLSPYLSFGNTVQCSSFFKINKTQDLEDYFTNSIGKGYLILGGGSNVLFLKEKTGLDILFISLKGKHVVLEEDAYDLVEFSAGENWHESVIWSLDQGYGGIENLSLIPGTIGAAPIQNIGAYGVEIKDVLHSVNVFDTKEKRSFILHNSECKFAYRDSIFKSKHKGKFVITAVTLKLKKSDYNINATYGAIGQKLIHKGIDKPSPKDISDLVIDIRKTKLPDPKELGNGGSFFKNPVVKNSVLHQILKMYSEVPHYPINENYSKLPAGWLIEKVGWKGKRVGNVGCHKDQALVIVNYGKATGQEIWNHALNVQASVNEVFGISLIPEVNIIEA